MYTDCETKHEYSASVQHFIFYSYTQSNYSSTSVNRLYMALYNKMNGQDHSHMTLDFNLHSRMVVLQSIKPSTLLQSIKPSSRENMGITG